eukprot:CAMPEP_0174371498 /NCGR_PEP_ID=MMETSP0811_2-20130205/99946_1 /TAXON_ID=73025 ORGANISM="Eutreptiella gymnastica-like, Strain CCMP1594" /NCGR_SAMPLE_ID=MMETSP0811_2 /ASSEMBLY_ACC=CAM_ASM_000667 /LENGTH=32 /DNA_ID= /DNA_START= /DNA_END= /DNA_ORIENTATION=
MSLVDLTQAVPDRLQLACYLEHSRSGERGATG